MGRKLYWIDDSTERMFEVIRGAIVESWKLDKEEEGIATKILIFGDAYQEMNSSKLWTKSEENEFNIMLHDLFIEQCEDVSGPKKNDDIVIGNIELIEDAIKIVFKEGDEEDDLKLYRNIRKVWENETLTHDEKEKYNEAKRLITQLIERMDIDEGEYVGIDLELLFDDITRTKEKKVIVSMELYNQLKAKGYKCFLFSTDAEDSDFIENWKKTYVEFYCKFYQIDDGRQPIIYRRRDFWQKGNTDMVNQIIGTL